MMNIPCNIKGCKELSDSTLELKLHNRENHFDYYKEQSKGDDILLLRNVDALKK